MLLLHSFPRELSVAHGCSLAHLHGLSERTLTLSALRDPWSSASSSFVSALHQLMYTRPLVPFSLACRQGLDEH